MEKVKPIVIIGGGPAGVSAALELDRLIGEDIARPIYLFDLSNNHTYCPRLFDVMNRENGVYTIPFEDIFAGTRVRFFKEGVTHIDFELNRVVTEKRQVVYDQVILAVGCDTDIEASGEAWQLDTVDQVKKTKTQLQKLLKQRGRKHYISIVGGGLRGVEAALSVMAWAQTQTNKNQLQDLYVTLIENGSRITPELSASTTRELTRILKRANIFVQLQKRRTWREHVAAQPKKDTSPYHSAIWATGLRPRELARQKGVPRGTNGRVRVTPDLHLDGQTNAWAVGSVASVAESASAMAAWRQGMSVARAITQPEKMRSYQPGPLEVFLPLNNQAMVRVTSDSVQAGFWVSWLAWWRDFAYLWRLVPIYQVVDLLLKRGGI